MALYQSKHATGKSPVVSITEASGGTLRYSFVFPGNLAVNDVIDLGDFPANTAPVDCTLIADDLDDGTGLVLSAGFLNAGKTDLGAGTYDTWIANSNIGQAGGVARPANANVIDSGAAKDVNRRLGIVVKTAAATPNMTGKQVVLLVNTVG